MKKLLTLALVLIMGLVIFSGCDNMDNPMVAETELSSDILNSNNKEEAFNYSYLFLVSSENQDSSNIPKLNPGLEHFILDLVNILETGDFELIQDDIHRTAYLNKLNVLLKLIEIDNTVGAIRKLENDIYNKNKWLNPEYDVLVITALEITHYILSNPENDYYYSNEPLETYLSLIDAGFDDNNLYANIYITTGGKIIIDYCDCGPWVE